MNWAEKLVESIDTAYQKHGFTALKSPFTAIQLVEMEQYFTGSIDLKTTIQAEVKAQLQLPFVGNWNDYYEKKIGNMPPTDAIKLMEKNASLASAAFSKLEKDIDWSHFEHSFVPEKPVDKVDLTKNYKLNSDGWIEFEFNGGRAANVCFSGTLINTDTATYQGLSYDYIIMDELATMDASLTVSEVVEAYWKNQEERLAIEQQRERQKLTGAEIGMSDEEITSTKDQVLDEVMKYGNR